MRDNYHFLFNMNVELIRFKKILTNNICIFELKCDFCTMFHGFNKDSLSYFILKLGIFKDLRSYLFQFIRNLLKSLSPTHPALFYALLDLPVLYTQY